MRRERRNLNSRFCNGTLEIFYRCSKCNFFRFEKRIRVTYYICTHIHHIRTSTSCLSKPLSRKPRAEEGPREEGHAAGWSGPVELGVTQLGLAHTITNNWHRCRLVRLSTILRHISGTNHAPSATSLTSPTADSDITVHFLPER